MPPSRRMWLWWEGWRLSQKSQNRELPTLCLPFTSWHLLWGSLFLDQGRQTKETYTPLSQVQPGDYLACMLLGCPHT